MCGVFNKQPKARKKCLSVQFCLDNTDFSKTLSFVHFWNGNISQQRATSKTRLVKYLFSFEFGRRPLWNMIDILWQIGPLQYLLRPYFSSFCPGAVTLQLMKVFGLNRRCCKTVPGSILWPLFSPNSTNCCQKQSADWPKVVNFFKMKTMSNQIFSSLANCNETFAHVQCQCPIHGSKSGLPDFSWWSIPKREQKYQFTTEPNVHKIY
jgi:hypothetical protein